MAGNTYETMVALNPNLEREALASLLDGFKGIIARKGGTIISEHDLGKKKFAYPVSKFSTGYYHLIYFTSPGDAVFELERNYKHSEEVLKFITLKLDARELKFSQTSLENLLSSSASSSSSAPPPFAGGPKEEDE